MWPTAGKLVWTSQSLQWQRLNVKILSGSGKTLARLTTHKQVISWEMFYQDVKRVCHQNGKPSIPTGAVELVENSLPNKRHELLILKMKRDLEKWHFISQFLPFPAGMATITRTCFTIIYQIRWWNTKCTVSCVHWQEAEHSKRTLSFGLGWKWKPSTASFS